MDPTIGLDYNLVGTRVPSSWKVRERSRVVHARVVDLRVRSVDTKEMVRVYREEVVPAAKQQRGFEGAFLLTDAQTGIGISITLWRTEADREVGEVTGFFDEQISKFSDLLTDTPVRRHYDLSVSA
jgi:heme-degrading monooxygenase HmoA